MGTQFILANRYVPDAFSPSSALWGDMLEVGGVRIELIADTTTPNTTGIIVKKSKFDQKTSNGSLDISKLLTKVCNGTFAMGYTNPYQSSTELNFLLTVLPSFAAGDEPEMLSPDVASTLEAFQAGLPFVAQNTLQMRDATQGSGVLDRMVMENKSWVNITGMAEYQFVSFGVRHDSPLYATPEAGEAEREVLKLFANFIDQRQQVANKFGFGQQPKYQNSYTLNDRSLIAQSQRIWKLKKSGGRPVTAMFVADISCSMKGTRLKNLKKALVDSSDLINANNAIGLITHQEKVNVDLYLRPFDVQQKAGVLHPLISL